VSTSRARWWADASLPPSVDQAPVDTESGCSFKTVHRRVSTEIQSNRIISVRMKLSDGNSAQPRVDSNRRCQQVVQSLERADVFSVAPRPTAPCLSLQPWPATACPEACESRCCAEVPGWSVVGGARGGETLRKAPLADEGELKAWWRIQGRVVLPLDQGSMAERTRLQVYCQCARDSKGMIDGSHSRI
jgi:hypothetical protein